MIEHTSNEILTFCIHVGYDISTAADFRFHSSMAKCQYFIIHVAFHSVVLRIATPAGNPVACALQESNCLGSAGNPIAWALQRERERERERDREATTESEKERKSDRETEIHATQCCSTRAMNGQVRKCNLMCLLCCSCEHAEMRRNGYHNEYHTMQCSQHMTMASNIPIHITMTPSITPTITSINKFSCHKKACA